MKIGFIGAGEMAQAIITGLLRSKNYLPTDILIHSSGPESTQKAADKLGVQTVKSNEELVEISDVVMLAVPANLALTVCESFKTAINVKKTIFISMAAGITIKQYEDVLGKQVGIIRIMPNVNVAVGEGMIGFTHNTAATETQGEVVGGILNDLGQFIYLKEADFTIFSAIGGSSPAFVYMFIDSLARAGVAYGLNKDAATMIAAQAVKGSAANLLESGENPWTLVDKVSSPGGTTIAGVLAMEKAGFLGSVTAGVEATVEKDLKSSK